MSTFIPPRASDGPSPEAREKARAMIEAALGPKPLLVRITHQPFEPWFTVEYGGQTEELDHEQALKWFAEHGAKDMDAVNEAICQAFNFHTAEFVIKSPKRAGPVSPTGVEPRI